MNKSQELLKLLGETYHPEDSMTHHLIHAYAAKKFGDQALYKKHLDFAMDHASNDPKNKLTRKDLEDMVAKGKTLFHDTGSDEIKKNSGFVKDQYDSEIGQ